MFRALPLALALLAAGCTQSYADGVRVICTAPQRCKDCDRAPLDQRALLMSQQIEGRLTNARAIELMSELAKVDPLARVKRLRAAAGETGALPCALADYWEKDSAVLPGPAPGAP